LVSAASIKYLYGRQPKSSWGIWWALLWNILSSNASFRLDTLFCFSFLWHSL
jgi:hypothetical protein